jgi:hypothetical protein
MVDTAGRKSNKEDWQILLETIRETEVPGPLEEWHNQRGKKSSDSCRLRALGIWDNTVTKAIAYCPALEYLLLLAVPPQ